MRADLSIIITAYNAEKTLERCLDSVLVQTKSELEIILIDDGSTDRTADICDRYGAKDSRIRVFHNTRQGIGCSRQFALERCWGEFVICVDADDWIEPDMMEILYAKALSEDSDMVICDMIEENGDSSVVFPQKPSGENTRAVLSDILFNRIHCSSCNKLLRRDCLTSNGIRYPHGLDFGEDLIFNVKLLCLNISVSYVPSALYHYDILANPASASKLVNKETLAYRERMTDCLGTMPSCREAAIYRYTELAFFALKYGFYDKDEYRAKFSKLSTLRWKEYSKVNSRACRLIVWCSFNLPFNVTRSLFSIEKFYRKF